jgi:hypothetical protein
VRGARGEFGQSEIQSVISSLLLLSALIVDNREDSHFAMKENSTRESVMQQEKI